MLDSRQLVRFVLTGGLATISYYIVAMSLDCLSQFPLMLINTIAYGFGFIVSYAGQKYWTFKNNKSHKRTLPLFIVASGVGFLLNSLMVWSGVKLGFSYAISALAAIVTVTAVSYLLQRYIVFK